MFEEHDEEVPLLLDPKAPSDPNSSSQTPLPIAQISILLTSWLAESIVIHSISPYLNQLVKELPSVGGDARRVGYYTGIIVSLPFVTEAATSFQWNRLSDHIGRKPVILACLAGMTLSILLFGLSHPFLALVLSRCLHGAVKGHIGAVKSTIAELTDETNSARGFSMPPVAWSLGIVIGPLIGGVLSRPQDRWPHTFSHPFWTDYPYFLPCLVSAASTFLSFIIQAWYLKETIHSKPSRKLRFAGDADGGTGESSDQNTPRSGEPAEKPLPLRSVLTKPVVISILNYAMFTLPNMVAWTYVPLVWSTPVAIGGLGLSPASIGLLLSVFGAINGIFQFAFYPHFFRRLGARNLFVSTIVSCAVIYMLFPLENLAARRGSTTVVLRLLVMLQLAALCLSEMGYATMYLYISSAVPNKRSLGAANGLAQAATSVQSAVGPAAADWLFAFSLTHNVLGGNFAYAGLVAVACVALGVAAYLPRKTWARHVG